MLALTSSRQRLCSTGRQTSGGAWAANLFGGGEVTVSFSLVVQMRKLQCINRVHDGFNVHQYEAVGDGCGESTLFV